MDDWKISKIISIDKEMNCCNMCRVKNIAMPIPISGEKNQNLWCKLIHRHYVEGIYQKDELLLCPECAEKVIKYIRENE